MVGLDLTVLNLALPTLASLHASTSDLQWFVDAYSLVLAAALLPAGLLGDRYGRKKVLLISLALFGLGSIACAYAPSAGALIAARAVLGLGAAAVLPLALSVLPVMFSARGRPKAVAVVVGVTFISFPIGPILGGWLLDNFWRGSVFLINVPVVVLALAAVALLMPESRGALRPRVDFAGVLISSLGLVALTYGVIRAGQDGWSNAGAITTIAVRVVLLAAFAAWERRVSGLGGQPLVDLTLFRSASFTWGTILATLVSFALFGFLFTTPQYFQDVRGLDALGAGVRLLPMIGGMMVGMIVGTRLQTGRINSKALVAPGFVLMAAALAVGAITTVHSGTGFAAGWFTVTGLGLAGQQMRSASEQDPAKAAGKAMPRCGLRERKKARTRAAIRQHALGLIREQGYAETTVDQIAEAAEVSPSTFFRYFPTKEDVVLQATSTCSPSRRSRSSRQGSARSRRCGRRSPPLSASCPRANSSNCARPRR